MKVLAIAFLGIAAAGLAFGDGSKETVTTTTELVPAKPAKPEKNLVKIEGVMLSKTAQTEEEEEEQAGMYFNTAFTNDYSPGHADIDATGSPEDILRYVAGRSQVHYQEVKLPKIQIHLKITSKSRAELLEKVAAAYAEVFKVQVTEGTRAVDGYSLEADRKVLRELPRPEGTENTRGKWEQKDKHWMTVVEGPLSFLASVIAQELHMQVVDESHLSAHYRIELAWTADHAADDLKKSLEKQGVKMVPTKVQVTGVYVGKLGTATAPAATMPKK